MPGIVVNSFAFEHGPINVYGLAAADGIMRTFDLNLVDWWRCATPVAMYA